MKLPLRYFILACLLLDAVGVPWAWRTYQAKRAAEIEKLEKELAELWTYFEDHAKTTAIWEEALSGKATTAQVIKRLVGYVARIETLNAQLEELTGKPRKPAPEFRMPQVGLSSQGISF